MAKYDPDRIAETADPFAPGTTGIEPLCDEFGRLIAAPTGGGGGGDASAANQVLALTALDSIYDALALVGTEATSADILAAVNSLGAGATLADLAAALAPLATEATQIDILDALTAQGVDIAASKAAIDLLVPDLDAVRVASESTASAVGTTADTDAGSTVVALLKWIKARLPVSLGGKTSAGSLSVTMATDQTAIPSSNAVSSQADGHSATIGATADADTALTVIGRLKKILATLTDGTAQAIIRSATKSTSTGAGITSTAASATRQPADVCLYDAAGLSPGFAAPGATATGNPFNVGFVNISGNVVRCVGSGNGGIGVALWNGSTPVNQACDSGGRVICVGAAASGAATQGSPVLIGGSNGTNTYQLATNTSGQLIIVGPGASTPATSISVANALASANAVGAISSAQFGVLKASAGRLIALRIESASAGTFYLQLHNATTTGAIAVGTIQGLGYTVSGVGDEFVVVLEAPISYATGVAWALSTTKNTYTAAAGKLAFVEGIWE